MIELFDAVALGIYLLFVAIHLDLWRKRRDRPSHFWLAGAGVGALLVDLTGMRMRALTPGSEGLILPAINLFGVALVTFSLFELVLSLGSESSGRLTRAGYVALFVLAIAAAAAPRLFPLFMIFSAILLLLAMIHAVRAALAGDREARTIAAGMLVLLTTLVIDIVMEVGVLPRLPGIPILGFTTLFLLSASALNSRYEREHRELLALQQDLELRVADRTSALEEANRQLAEASRTDALTGLPNRRAFLEVSDYELKRAARAEATCSVVMMDLDHFKEVNDRHGHAAGDDLLKAAAARLRSVMRAEDLVARWGGEEFILLLPDTDAIAAAVAVEKARAALESHVLERDGTRLRITASFGIAAHRGGQPLDATIAAADDALYRAKESGRNRVVVG